MKTYRIVYEDRDGNCLQAFEITAKNNNEAIAQADIVFANSNWYKRSVMSKR